MATPDVVRPSASRIQVGLVGGLTAVALSVSVMACAESSPPPKTAVSQQQLTSAEVTNVQFKLPTGYGEVSPPPSVATPLQRQMEDDQKYPVPSAETANEWRARYPFPAKMLRDWRQDHPDSADRLLRWENEQPDHVSTLVRWAISNPYEPLGGFMMNRGGWSDLRAMRDADPIALDDFLAWCRAAPRAAEELVLHSEGIGSAMTAPRR